MIFSKLLQFEHRTVNLITIGRKINMGSESGLASNKRLANARKMTNQRINTHACQNSAYGPRTNWTQEGTAVMRSCITRYLKQYLKQWLMGAWIHVFTHKRHSQIRESWGVCCEISLNSFWGVLYVLLCIFDENRWSCTKSQGIVCQGYCIVCFFIYHPLNLNCWKLKMYHVYQGPYWYW